MYPESPDDAERISWAFEFISLTPESLEFPDEYRMHLNVIKPDQLLNAGFVWSPAQPGLSFREIPGAPAPAESDRQRLVQLRDLIKRFAVTEYVTRQPDLLRLMPHPIDRYSDPAKGQLDGAIYLFAHGTNPEAMLVIEAQGSSPEKATWRFAVARLTVAPFEVTFDRKAVWSEAYHPDAKNRPTAPYFTYRCSGKQ